MSDILWLASYPKSGNTWMRIFLANLMAGRGVGINAVSFSDAAASRDLFDATIGIEASDLTPEEIQNYRPSVYRLRAQKADSRLFVKAHDAFGPAPSGQSLFPADASFFAIYIVRNPLDVAVSYAHHLGIDLDRTIDFLANNDARTSGDETSLSEQLGERLSSWSGHALSWADQSEIPVHVVRYEDMSVSPLKVFTQVAAVAQIEANPEEIASALEMSSFERLRSQEISDGFREGFLANRPFFREGKVGSWRHALSESQVSCIVERHGSVMERFGYLSPSRQLLV